jgi:hypothetical protein
MPMSFLSKHLNSFFFLDKMLTFTLLFIYTRSHSVPDYSPCFLLNKIFVSWSFITIVVLHFEISNCWLSYIWSFTSNTINLHLNLGLPSTLMDTKLFNKDHGNRISQQHYRWKVFFESKSEELETSISNS